MAERLKNKNKTPAKTPEAPLTAAQRATQNADLEDKYGDCRVTSGRTWKR